MADIVRVNSERSIVIGQRPIHITFETPGVAALTVGLRVFGSELDRPLEIGNGLVEICLSPPVDRAFTVGKGCGRERRGGG